MEALDIPEAWKRAADRMAAEGWRTILVIGAADVGKSSFCAFLVSWLLSAHRDVAVIDADIGQKDIGPPAAIALGYPKPGTGLCNVEPAAFYFVGSTNPVGRFLPLVIGTARLARQAEAPVAIVNTTGLIHGVGRVLKGYKIEAVQPDVVVAIERRDELASILGAYRYLPVVRLAPSSKARVNSPKRRMLKREKAFARYFAEASREAFDIDTLVIQPALPFAGAPAPMDGALSAERTSSGLTAADPERKGSHDATSKRAGVMKAGFERNLLCGVGDANGRGVGLAIIEAIDFASGKLALLTPVKRSQVTVIQLGDLYIGPEGRELVHSQESPCARGQRAISGGDASADFRS